MSSGHDTRNQTPVAPLSSSADQLDSGAAPAVAGSGKLGKSAGKRSAAKNSDTGSALRWVYQRMVSEAVPDEMLDLLGKLD